MILDLSHIRQPETAFSRRYEASAFDGRGVGFRVAAPVDLALAIRKDRDRFHLTGSVRTVLELTCSRCAEPFALTVDAPVDVRYLPQSENVASEHEIEEDDLSDAFYRDDQIDLGQLMDEQFYLALPMKPLCTAECRGLCPNCGTNLNLKTCTCEVRWEDPRLAGLKALFPRDNDNA